jgi:hypothetical protein
MARLMELNAAGRLSVMVATGPSIRSSAGSSGRDVGEAGVVMAGDPGRRLWLAANRPQKGWGDNPSALVAALAPAPKIRPNGLKPSFGTDTSAALPGEDSQPKSLSFLRRENYGPVPHP